MRTFLYGLAAAGLIASCTEIFADTARGPNFRPMTSSEARHAITGRNCTFPTGTGHFNADGTYASPTGKRGTWKLAGYVLNMKFEDGRRWRAEVGRGPHGQTVIGPYHSHCS